jgi:hypothetical protein
LRALQIVQKFLCGFRAAPDRNAAGTGSLPLKLPYGRYYGNNHVGDYAQLRGKSAKGEDEFAHYPRRRYGRRIYLYADPKM